MGSGAKFPLMKLFVALPDGLSILGVRVPYLPSIKSTALPANNPAGKAVDCAGVVPCCLSSPELLLHKFKGLWWNDGWMRVFNIILWHFTLVYFGFFCKKICRQCLLEYSVALIFLIGKDAFYSTLCPIRFAARGRYSFFSEVLGNTIRGLAFKKEFVYEPYYLGFLFDNLRCIVFSLFIAEELAIWKAYLSVSKALSLAPRGVL